MNFNVGHPSRHRSFNDITNKHKSFENQDMLKRSTETTRHYNGYAVTTSTISSNVKVLEKKNRRHQRRLFR